MTAAFQFLAYEQVQKLVFILLLGAPAKKAMGANMAQAAKAAKERDKRDWKQGGKGATSGYGEKLIIRSMP